VFRTQTHHKPELAFQYAKGLFQAQKANIERMCERVNDSQYHQIQHFISESPWQWRPAFDSVAKGISDAMEQVSGKVGLLIDESAHLKKGKESVGVARQYCGTIGKVDNGQVAVYGGLSTQNYYGLIDAALYLPSEWTDDAARCKKAGIPQEFRTYKTKPQLATDMVRRQKENGVKFDFVGADGLYGNAPHFLRSLDEMELLFVVEIHSNERVYEQPPVISIPEATGLKGRKPSAYKCDGQSREVRHLLETIPQEAWEEVVVRQGTKGVLRYMTHVRKVYTWEKGAASSCERLLIVRKTNTMNGVEIKYAFSNAAEGEYTNTELAQMQSQRYFVERCFQDAKQEMGMSQYQVRGWLAWHHHIALVMLSMEFVLTEKMLFKNEYPLLTSYDIREVFINLYTRKGATFDEVMEQMKHRHAKRNADIDRNRGH
jgi:SRSO17 transposase